MNFGEDINVAIKKELSNNTLIDKAFGVKIVLHHSTSHCAIRETIYYNKGFRFECFMRWQWYFRYKAALLQVQNPKFCVELISFSYELKSEKTRVEKRIRDIISAKRRKITIAKNRLDSIAKKYTGLFPITEDPAYIKAVQTVQKYESQLSDFENKTFSSDKVGSI